MAFPSRSAPDPGSPRSGFARARRGGGYSPSETVRRCIRLAPRTPRRWRQRLFFRELGVPDTVNGRFDMLVLHLWMVLRRLKPTKGGGAGVSQALFDYFCDDLDANLREMGVGDLTVPKRMQAFGEAFYGRAAAYDLALAAGAEPLAQALCKNILNGKEIENARRLAFYVETAVACLAGLDDAALQSASWRFSSPARVSVQQ